ncbi:phage tail protein [Shewanella subflava]|uniref:Phage tail protein n=1 Tax=Shewanella subflava TaxID=2986476 RepID=A0ABT3I564_9GAMM|nr:phage tail protein [Shewanella subflava]MCW3171206.1 phage tail protein [Shewanella subflava]
MASVITIAGEQLFAAKAQANEQLDIDTFIFANVPNQDPSAPINREEGIPTAHIVYQQNVQQVGRINDNVVVYSTVLDSITGPFEFNWVGLYSSVNQKLVAINHVPTVTKTATAPGEAGNTLNRNFGIEYSGIAALTNITVDAETWQLNFTARLSGMDLLTQQLAADMNGKDWFIDDGLKVVPRATANTFSVTPGVGYVSGLRVELAQEHILIVQSYPQFVYVDAWFSGNANSTWSPQLAFTVTNTEMDDYIDPSGTQHYVYKLAVINADDGVEDLRDTRNIAERSTFKPSFVSEAVNNAITIQKTIGVKLEDFKTIDAFGAVGDGSSHPLSEFFKTLEDAKFVYPQAVSLEDEIDWAAAQLMANKHKIVGFRQCGNYVFNKPVLYKTQTSFYAPSLAMSFESSRQATIKINRETWSGDAILKKESRESGYQSILVNGLFFEGFAEIYYNKLYDAENIEVTAIDCSYIRDGLIIRNCGFNKLGSAFKQISMTGYLGFVVCEGLNISQCYLACEAYPTTRMTMMNTRIYDCYDWVKTNHFYGYNVAFNNSSRASENCGIHANAIYTVGCWYEGGNHWFDTSNSTEQATVTVVGGVFSEAMSEFGYNKVILKPSLNMITAVSIKGVKMPTNTRMFGLNIPTAGQWKNVFLTLESVSNISGGLWCLGTTNLSSLMHAGLNYRGFANKYRKGEPSDDLVNTCFGLDDIYLAETYKNAVKLTSDIGKQLTVSHSLNGSASQFTNVSVGCATIKVCGHDNGAGGDSIYALQFDVIKGYGSNWTLCEGFSQSGVKVTSISKNGFTVTISNASESGCTLNITPTHSGNKNDTIYYVKDSSSNVTVKEV